MATNNAINFSKPFSGFNAYRSANLANQTGDGSVATASLNAEAFDTGDYNTGTYTYVCPKSGLYLFRIMIDIYNLSSGAFTAFTCVLVTSNGSYILWNINPSQIKVLLGSNVLFMNNFVVTNMDETDTAFLTFAVSGAGKTVGLAAGIGYSSLSASLLIG